MTDPNHRPEHDELDLDGETVKDLDPAPADGDDVRGGNSGTHGSGGTVVQASGSGASRI